MINQYDFIYQIVSLLSRTDSDSDGSADGKPRRLDGPGWKQLEKLDVRSKDQ